MQLRVGYEFDYRFPQPTPCLLVLNIHHSRISDPSTPDTITTTPSTKLSSYRDGFGNWCCRLVAPAGRVRVSADSVVQDTGAPDPIARDANQVQIENLPDDAPIFLLASRFCECDEVLNVSWQLFGKTRPG